MAAEGTRLASDGAADLFWQRGVKTMRNAGVVLAALAVLAVAGRSPAEDNSAPAEDRLVPLERFVGEWVVDAKWSSGESLHARSVYQWGLGKKILKAQTFVGEGDKEYQRYEGVMAWHPDKKCLYEISFAFDGALSEYLIEAEGKDTFHIGRVPVNPDKPGKVRQVLKFLDKDHFQWVVSVKDGEDWKQLIDATWKRKEK
jgi:hypothetical protein